MITYKCQQFRIKHLILLNKYFFRKSIFIKQVIFGRSLLLIFLLCIGSSFVQAQFYKGPVHCIGNGKCGVYEQGINIIRYYGQYTSPSILNASIIDAGIRVETQRETGTDIYTHTLYKGDENIGTITDFVSSRSNCFCRMADLKQKVDFSFEYSIPDDKIDITDYPVFYEKYNVSNAKLVTVLPGAYYYNDYPVPYEMNHFIMSKGTASFIKKDEGHKRYSLEFEKGKGMVFFVSGPSFPELNENMESFFSQSPEELLKQTREDWSGYINSQNDFATDISDNNPDKRTLLKAIDDVSVLLKTQQGVEGGVMVGHYWPGMGFVRDNYGAARGFLVMGYDEQAREILEFFFDVWKENGVIKNAQAFNFPGSFHKHENDEVEVTGYLMIQAFDYYKKTNDKDFLIKLMPFLEWCWEVQKKNLVAGMLPFNGDETYIAGGLIPRKVINDGSAEATLYFIEGGTLFLDFAKREKLKDSLWLSENLAVLSEVSEKYRDNFIKDGRLMLNNPKRAELCTYPEYRYGVCMYPGHEGYRGILKHYKGSLYFSKEWYGKADSNIEPEPPEEFYLSSVNLTPIFINSTLFSRKEKENMLNKVVEVYKKTGKIIQHQSNERLLGYDYGLFLYALVEFNNPLAGEIFKKMMELRDETGAWNEYYLNDVPCGTCYRIWESGINIEAAIRYVKQQD